MLSSLNYFVNTFHINDCELSEYGGWLFGFKVYLTALAIRDNEHITQTKPKHLK
jgi:hypothetical protein